MKRYIYDSECINAVIEVEVYDEDTYAVIDDNMVSIIPNYKILKDGKETSHPITEGSFRRGGECTSLKREREKFNEWLREVLKEHTIEKPLPSLSVNMFKIDLTADDFPAPELPKTRTPTFGKPS